MFITFTKLMRYLIILLLLSSCTTIKQSQPYRISYSLTEVDAIVFPADIGEAYEFMSSIKKQGFTCDDALTHCEGKETIIDRVTDSLGTIILITEK